VAATGRTNAPSPRASWARPPEPRAERRPGVVAAPGCPSATTVTQRQTPSNALPCAFAPLRLSVALLPFALCACWSQQPAAARADYQQAQKNAEALQKQGQFREAITACEAFMRAHPDATAGCQQLANLVDRILLRDIKERDQTVPICEAAVKEFEGVPYYWAVCAKYVIQAKMWRAGEQGEAADLANQVVEKLGDNLPQGYVASALLMFHVYALRNAGRFDEALEAAKKDAKLRPLLLSNDEFFQALYGAVSGAKKPDQLLSVAKLAFVLSDFQEGSLTRATELVTKALTSTQGPGVAIQFAKSQGTLRVPEDPEAPNPLKDVPLLDLGDGKAIVAAAAETDTDGRFNALLYAGTLAEAVELAKEQLRISAGVDSRMATALRNLARCFKAHDLNLIRANQFLEFHRTGAGVNPLPALEGELANAVTP